MKKQIRKIIKTALKEDFNRSGDITSKAVFNNEKDTYCLYAKGTGILCGIDIFRAVFLKVDRKCKIDLFYKDGDTILSGYKIACITGKIKSILSAERTAINIISHLSGISTKTYSFVSKSKDRAVILDTRKTIPGLRYLEKYAVKCGGGDNHRMGLFDMILIKDNHIDGAGSIKAAVEKTREKWGSRYKIEVETRTLKEVEEALNADADRIMLDNMDTETMKKAVLLINRQAEVEVSGNIKLERIEEIASTGVDYISIGELTHSLTAFDFSLRNQNA